jgi:hypothetical protein
MSDLPGMASQVEPGDFCVLPMVAPFGPVVAWAQWLAEILDQHRLGYVQNYGHAEFFIGGADAAGPYGYTASAYPDRKGIRPLPCPPEQLRGALWSTGIIALTAAQRAVIVAWCRANPDVPYGPLVYVAIALHDLGIAPPARLLSRIASTGQMICSQFIDAGCQGAGVELPFPVQALPGFPTPLDLALMLESRGARAYRG